MRPFLSRLDKNRALGVAAEMAFWLFLSLLPLAAVAGMIVAKIASNDASFSGDLLESLPQATRDLVSRELGSMSAWNGGRFGLVAAAMFLWLASSGIASLFEGIEIETEAKPRSWLRRRALALGACVALSAGIALLAAIGVGIGWVRDAIGAPQAFTSFGWTAARLFLGAGVSLALLSGIYWIAVPRPTRDTMPILPGAILALALQVAGGFGYSLYVRTLGDGGAYQAGLASIGVTMVALYLFCVALLVGVELNQYLGERAKQKFDESPAGRASARPAALASQHG